MELDTNYNQINLNIGQKVLRIELKLAIIRAKIN